MSLRFLVAAFAARVGHPGQKLVLLKLADNANDDGIAWPSKKRIAYETELSEASVKRYLAELAEKNIIVIHRRKKDGVNLPSQYELIGLAEFANGWGHTEPRGVGSHRAHPGHTDPGGGVCVTPEPPISEPSTPPPPAARVLTAGGGGGFQEIWLEAAALEIEIASMSPRGVRNVAGLRKTILQRYEEQNGPDAEVLAELAHRRAAAEAATAAETARQTRLAAPLGIDREALARGNQLLATIRDRRRRRETEEETA